MAPGTERSPEAFVRAALAGGRFAQVGWVDETGSTNDDLLERARRGEPEQVLVTDLQTAGKGRRGRVWEAPPRSSILMSVLIRGRSPADAFWSVGAVALAASQAITPLVEVPSTLKWPNDVMLGDDGDQKKVAGVLAQVSEHAIIVGIGINVNWPAEVPPAMAERGTAVNRHAPGGAPIERPPLVVDIVQRAIGHLERDRDGLRAAWKSQCSTLGRRVRLELDGANVGSITGIAADIESDGALVLERDGTRSTHQVGDVVHLRRSP